MLFVFVEVALVWWTVSFGIEGRIMLYYESSFISFRCLLVSHYTLSTWTVGAFLEGDKKHRIISAGKRNR